MTLECARAFIVFPYFSSAAVFIFIFIIDIFFIFPYAFCLFHVKGREDDNIETIRKRFKVYMESSLPVVEYYSAKGKVRKVQTLCLLSSSLLPPQKGIA